VRRVLVCLLLGLGTLAGAESVPEGAVELASAAGAAPLLTGASNASEILSTCRAMLPVRPTELTGALILRNRKGIVASEHDYRLVMRRSAEIALLTVVLTPRGETNEVASVTISRRGDARPTINFRKAGAVAAVDVESPLARVLETDVTWLDLTMDFLWWKNPYFEAEREGESVHGQDCSVILVKPDHPIKGLSAVRLWVDKKTGCLMQAEQVGEDGKPIRRLWGTRVKKLDGRWFVSVLEVETLGTRHRTKITVDGMRDL